MRGHRISLLALCVVVGALSVAIADGPSSAPVGPGGPDLQTLLEKGLRARRPQEFAFVAQVTALVDEGTLPESLVLTSYLWARHHRPWPFPYFEKSLRMQAQKMGVAF